MEVIRTKTFYCILSGFVYTRYSSVHYLTRYNVRLTVHKYLYCEAHKTMLRIPTRHVQAPVQCVHVSCYKLSYSLCNFIAEVKVVEISRSCSASSPRFRSVPKRPVNDNIMTLNYGILTSDMSGD